MDSKAFRQGVFHIASLDGMRTGAILIVFLSHAGRGPQFALLMTLCATVLAWRMLLVHQLSAIELQSGSACHFAKHGVTPCRTSP